ncbi:MAG: HTTM domain-containing protein, partial [Planctomycetes bacterium]|nr:HTTM domain-containing protein [Planctomycetota bacterium]
MPFLFAPESPRRVAAMRIGLGGTMLYDAALRWPYVVELYSREGMPMPLHPGTSFEPAALDAAMSCTLYAVLLFVLAAVAVGWRTRLSLLAGLVLSAWFGVLDTPGTFKKYSVIALHLSFLLLFCESAAVWSVDALLNPNRRRLTRLTPAWPRRLMQFLIVSIYFGSVVTKVRWPDFSRGELLMFSLLDDRWGGNWFGMWLATHPKFVVLASYGTLLIEFAAVFLLWMRKTRIPMLVLLAAFHLSIGWSMHVGIFSPIMLLGLLAFVQESDLKRIGRLFPPWRSNRGAVKNRIVADAVVLPAADQTPLPFSAVLRRTLPRFAAYAAVASVCA